jgi:hypothetical protein
VPVNTPNSQYEANLPKWKRCRDVAEGTDAVKAAGREYLPELDSHRDYPAKYSAYLMRGLFYNAVGRTVDGLAGAICQKSPAIEVPSVIEDHLDDVTLTGVGAELFGYQVLRDVINPGRYGILLDMTDAESTTARPYWCGYRAEDIISWRTERIGGDQTLTRVVLCEYVEVQDPRDPFVSKLVEQYRVLEMLNGIYFISEWQQDQNKAWVKVSERIPTRRGDPLTFIPFKFVNSVTNTADIEKSPLIDLVDVNLSHYRNSADLEHGLHFVGVPQLVLIGQPAGQGPTNEPIKFGSGSALCMETGGDAKILQANGELLGALERADERKRRLMATLGARLLEEQSTTQETLGAVGLRHAGEHATLRTIAGSVEQALTIVLQWHAWWVGTEAEPGDVEASYELNKAYMNVKASPDEVRVLMEAWQADAISFDTFYAGIQRGDWARPGIDAEQEKADIAKQPSPKPALDLLEAKLATGVDDTDDEDEPDNDVPTKE